GWLVRNRRLARDYERLTATSEAMIKVAMIRLLTSAGQGDVGSSRIRPVPAMKPSRVPGRY
ncbi:hypothetical protein ACFYSB_34970, partial [Streptomyces prasinus]